MILRHAGRAAALLAFVASTFSGFVAAANAQDKFVPGCTLPHAAIAKKHAIDRTCGAEGTTESDPHKAQNKAKNNFCAKPPAIPVAYQTFLELQKEVDRRDIPYGSSNKLPQDRNVLEKMVKAPNGKWKVKGASSNTLLSLRIRGIPM